MVDAAVVEDLWEASGRQRVWKW